MLVISCYIIFFLLLWTDLRPNLVGSGPTGIRKQAIPCDGHTINPTELWIGPTNHDHPIWI